MITEAQLEHTLIMVASGKGLRDALRLAAGVELTEELQKWFLEHHTAAQDYLNAKQKASKPTVVMTEESDSGLVPTDQI